jgi:transmembrane sensor
MDRKMLTDRERDVSREAAEWLTTLEKGDARDRKNFAAWLSRSPIHVQEFLNMTAIECDLENVPPDYVLDVAQVRARRLNGPAKPDELHRRASAVNLGSARSLRTLALAALLAAIAVGTTWWVGARTAPDYTTTVGEQRTLALPDGSVVSLNARSRVEIEMHARSRNVRLIEGEALFKVRADSARPFIVHAGTAAIQAVGTQFNVDRRDREVRVAVLEGAVRISVASQPAPQPVRAGEEANIALEGPISIRHQMDMKKTLAWRERRLVFDGTPLTEIAAEFNRYNGQFRMRVEGAATQRRFTGVFDADDPESFVALLKKDRYLSLTEQKDEVMIR